MGMYTGAEGFVSVSMRGILSKCDWRGTEIVESDEIREEMTSGDAGSTAVADGSLSCVREGMDL